MKLIHNTTGSQVQVGDKVKSFRGENAVVKRFSKPHKPASQGKVLTTLGEHYVAVYDMKWVDREDR